LDNQGTPITSLGSAGLGILYIVTFLTSATLIWIAASKRETKALGLLVGPPLLLSYFWFLGKGAIAFQLVGIAYPFSICALILIYDSLFWVKGPKRSTIALILPILFFAVIGLRLPRFIGSFHRYVGNSEFRPYWYALSDFNQIEAIVGTGLLELDVPQIHHATATLVELGRRNMRLEWEANTWKLVGSHWDWPYPGKTKPDYKLTLLDHPCSEGVLAFKTPQFLLYRMH